MMKTQLATFLITLVFVLSSTNANDQTSGRRPNVVFILADDLGWSDTELYGQTKLYQTPNVLRLAERGMTFSRAYSASPLCSPTRASILTGLHPARIGLTSPGCHLPKVQLVAKQGIRTNQNVPSIPIQPVTRLNTSYFTLAQMFRDTGYQTAHFGKWHLGHAPYSPLEHGFEIDIPHWPGPGPAGSYVAPWKFPDFDPDTPNEHIEDRMAKEAVKFIETNKDQPFFLNYWMFSVHAPFDAKRELIEKYKSQIDPEGSQRSPTYAAMVESMDDAVGTLIDALEKHKLLENTIIVFFSDNGGNMYNEVDGVPPTNNFPLRGGKATMFEGGVRVPCIVSYPGRIQPGSRSDRLIQSTDFFPTLLDLMGRVESIESIDFDGKSFAKTLLQKSKEKTAPRNLKIDHNERPIFTYFPHQPKVPDWIPPSVSVHQGNWKLIRIFYGGKKGRDRFLLFDLKKDPGETENLADRRPAIVIELNQKLELFLAETNAVLPRRNEQFDFANYNLEKEGVADLKKKGRPAKRKPARSVRRPKVAGWLPEKDCQLKFGNGKLLVESTGGDPHFSFELPKPLPAGKYQVQLEMSSTAQGTAQFFWQEQGVPPKFIRHRSKTFAVEPDSKTHAYTINFDSPHKVLAVRLDPAQKAGKIVITRIRLTDSSGKTVNLLASN